MTATQPVTRAGINRANAQKSTGPKTAEGKAASSGNSYKHGLYSKQLVIRGEDPAALDALKADLFAEHQPGNETEAFLVNEIADHQWRLRRARAMEAIVMNSDEPLITHINAVLRQMASAERGIYRALRTLRAEQKGRGFVPQPVRKEPVETAKATGSGSVPQQKPSPQPGSVPQKTQPRLTEEDLEMMEREFAGLERMLKAA